MPGKWISQMRSKGKKGARVGSFDPSRFEALCKEDLEGACKMLAQDYNELHEEFETRISHLRDELGRFGDRMETATKKSDEKELQALRERYDHLRRLLRRLEASLMRTRDLEEDVQDWEQRRGERGPRHADHPEVRSEIAQSELRLRQDGRMKAIPKNATKISTFVARKGSVKTREDIKSLLRAIQHASREAEKWHDIPYPNSDAAEHVRNVRELHALLKQLDREAGHRRNRLPLALRMQSFVD